MQNLIYSYPLMIVFTDRRAVAVSSAPPTSPAPATPTARRVFVTSGDTWWRPGRSPSVCRLERYGLDCDVASRRRNREDVASLEICEEIEFDSDKLDNRDQWTWEGYQQNCHNHHGAAVRGPGG